MTDTQFPVRSLHVVCHASSSFPSSRSWCFLSALPRRSPAIDAFTSLAFLVLVAAACGQTVADDWPQWRGPTRDGVWHETGIIERFNSPELPIRWRAPVGSGYSGPTVADGRVYVTDHVVEPTQQERVHCFDGLSGKPLWTYAYDCIYRVSYGAGPRASVTIDDGRAYSLGTMGHLFCFRANDGSILWQHDLSAEYQLEIPTWGMAASPLVEGDLLIVQIGGNDACLVALDKRTGEERWRSLKDKTSYSAPIMIEQGNQRVLVCLTGDNVVGLNPKSGEPYWRIPFPPRLMVISAITPVVDRDRLFVANFYDGSLLMKLASDKPAVTEVWRRVGRDEQHTDALQPMIGTPLIQGDYIYGVDSNGELRCLDLANGDRVWESLSAVPKARWSTIHFIKHDEQVWMFNERGELIIGLLSPQGFEEISRAKLIDPTTVQLRQRGGVCWSHPAFANKHVFARNDKELVCASLAAE